jgi:hypothetical protein
MSEPELTDAIIREAMLRAEHAVCAPADQRCYGFPWGVEGARKSRPQDAPLGAGRGSRSASAATAGRAPERGALPRQLTAPAAAALGRPQGLLAVGVADALTGREVGGAGAVGEIKIAALCAATAGR